jgi:hypothetical protein
MKTAGNTVNEIVPPDEVARAVVDEAPALSDLRFR